MTTAYENGRQARLDGQSVNDNPHIIGKTKLGNNRLSEEGIEWDRGFSDAITRVATAKEIADARKHDLSPYRRKSNRYYAS